MGRQAEALAVGMCSWVLLQALQGTEGSPTCHRRLVLVLLLLQLLGQRGLQRGQWEQPRDQ